MPRRRQADAEDAAQVLWESECALTPEDVAIYCTDNGLLLSAERATRLLNQLVLARRAARIPVEQLYVLRND